ncbi:hypothetical protein K2Z83_02855 [Oscillochloris sp. ZM17-4]|uniref:hypothetical protein n=1 Tax=Oscillochloris sp. ZM17-4 TaxID=2866714 RepID=UPI001C72EB25|nr:hypothetical protein [Oscillochloris sp. ZM17-4]MBX0326621.1 hypothetical protein [Oscillochloris sp. ZM17-4]
MSERLSLELPDTLMRSARAVASQTHRGIEEVLIEWLDRAAAEIPVDQLPDEQVLALRDLQMSDSDQHELSDLLAKQREGLLSAPGRQRLDLLMRQYRSGMVRKAQALKVAVERGLQPPLHT